MARGILIRFKKYIFRLNENFVVFNPEKKNPYVKHLLSLKVCKVLHLPHKSHLKHLRLLKSLDLKGITLTDSLLNEIGMLVHLKYLIIQTKAKALPPSFSNLCNLETLMVDNAEGSYMILSPCFWSLAKLQDVRMKCGALFEPTVLDEDLRVEFSEWQVDAEKSFPVLEKLCISGCDKLMEIPDSFGDIASLELIKVWHSPQLKESTFKIKEYVEEMTGDDKLEVEFYG
ncbi:hypothetical protein H5410_029513 [Solanum commersonii]|uniref:Uncharacterized protein n=1 Tax=Solanum commersonii TaxID=4109 RepID=A0A9J5Z705_SOLCO|nr:hypothetical protein H5410_029513 [Solanum commersonii]